mgnify:CR=1 FL=1
MSNQNMMFIGLNALSGQKNAIIFYITQFARLLDIADLMSARDFIFKKQGFFARVMERTELLKVYDELAYYGFPFQKLVKLRKDELVIYGEDFPIPRLLRNPLPKGWNDHISKFMREFRFDEEEEEETGEEDDIEQRIIELRKTGLSYRQIAKAIGCTLWRVQKTLQGRSI